MPVWPNVLMTPLHVNGCRTEAEYRTKQHAAMAQGRAHYPQFKWSDPWICGDAVTVVVSGGKWLVCCRCGNYPSVHPDWRLALCFECGAMYERVQMPADAVAIEAVLVERPSLANRAWLPHESVDDLIRQNIAHQIPVPAPVVAALAARTSDAQGRR